MLISFIMSILFVLLDVCVLIVMKKVKIKERKK